jgi:L-malate glycosyltransferase
MSARVLVLTPYLYNTAPGPRSSFELWERVLREVDIHLDYAAFETERLHELVYQPGRVAGKALATADAYARFVAKLRSISDYDAVLVNREATLIGPAMIERWVVRHGTPMIYWIDDPLYIPYRSPSNGFLSYLKFFGKVETLCRISKLVMTNSPSHTVFARRFNADVREVPSLVDAERYTGWLPRPANGCVCVGWSGSSSTAQNLRLISGSLRRLSSTPDVELRFIGARGLELQGVDYVAQRWCAESEIDDLRQFDIGLVPVPTNPWAPHKFYLKLVQYMALGIPPVATPIGSNPLVIEDGVSGFLVRNEAEWDRALARLISDPDLREQVGKRAAEVAHQRYTVQANAEKIVAAFQAALSRR